MRIIEGFIICVDHGVTSEDESLSTLRMFSDTNRGYILRRPPPQPSLRFLPFFRGHVMTVSVQSAKSLPEELIIFEKGLGLVCMGSLHHEKPFARFASIC